MRADSLPFRGNESVRPERGSFPKLALLAFFAVSDQRRQKRLRGQRLFFVTILALLEHKRDLGAIYNAFGLSMTRACVIVHDRCARFQAGLLTGAPSRSGYEFR